MAEESLKLFNYKRSQKAQLSMINLIIITMFSYKYYKGWGESVDFYLYVKKNAENMRKYVVVIKWSSLYVILIVILIVIVCNVM